MSKGELKISKFFDNVESMTMQHVYPKPFGRCTCCDELRDLNKYSLEIFEKYFRPSRDAELCSDCVSFFKVYRKGKVASNGS
jgi:hypothetical protein